MSTKLLHIKVNERDIAALKLISNSAQTIFQQPKEYKNQVVLKPWGFEFLIYENASVAIWFLHITQDFATSMHCHPKKKTSLIVLEGEAQCSFLNHREALNAIESIRIDKGVFHSTKALSEGGIRLIEVESPPLKTDLVRLKDAYGRQTQGYEGLSEMVTSGLQKYGYFYLDESFISRNNKHSLANCNLVMKEIITSTELNNIKWQAADHYLACKGDILDRNENVVLEVGDIKTGRDLLNFNEPLLIRNPLTLIQFENLETK